MGGTVCPVRRLLHPRLDHHVGTVRRSPPDSGQQLIHEPFLERTDLLELLTMLVEESGLVGPYRGSQARQVLMTLDEWERARSEA